MNNFLIRQIERLFVFGLGVSVAYIALWQLFPRLDYRLPLFFAFIVCYVGTVYILIPLAYRLYRIVKKPNHIPSHTSTPDGFPCDPINIVLIGSKVELQASMEAAGWHRADNRSLKTLWRLLLATATNTSYKNAPFSTLYLFGRGQDFGYQIEVAGSPRQRHHIRFWAVNTDVEPKFTKHVELWRRHHYFQIHKKNSFMWVGAATFDVGIGLIRYNGQLSHTIDPNTNKERDFVATSLKQSGWIRSSRQVKAHNIVSIKNRVLGVTMKTDGDVLVIDLAKPKKNGEKL